MQDFPMHAGTPWGIKEQTTVPLIWGKPSGINGEAPTWRYSRSEEEKILRKE